jgi:glyoxylase-like metal-dependent hydrolase (beta-lactamase superfamily II)
LKRFAALTIVFVLSAVAPAFAQPAQGIRLYVFTAGSLGAFPKAALQIAGQATVEAAPVFYVITHPKGNVLVETGNTERTMPDAGGWWGPLAKGFGLKMTANDVIAVQLAKIGLKLSDIKFVVLGQMYSDRSSDRSARMGKFLNATFVVQSDEPATTSGEPGASMYYVPGDFADGQKHNVVRLDGNLDLFNDRSIEVIRAPGQIPGGQFALVRLPKQGTVLLTDKNLVPRGTWSPLAMYEGSQKMRQLRDTEGASIIFKATRQAPDYYE